MQVKFIEQESGPELMKDIELWTERLALLRGDNLYDLTRLFFAGHGIDCRQVKLKAGIPHAAIPHRHVEHLFELLDKDVLKPLGLKFIRFIMGRLVCTEDRIVGALINPKTNVTSCEFDLLGTRQLVAAVGEAFGKLVKYDPPPVINRLTLSPDGGIGSTRETIPVLPRVAEPGLFYPYFERTPAETWAAFAASRSNVLLLVGPPGTGKSNFITEMMHSRGWDDQVHLADRQDVIQHAGLSDYIRSLPDGSVMITEDSDILVMARKDGNQNMAALLNATSGIASREVKIIISTNLESVQRVDPALLRPGRCFDILEFDEITGVQAMAVRQMMELDALHVEESTVTLAEAINYHERRGGRKAQQPFGFAAAT